MEYLVTMTTHVPDGTSEVAVSDVRAREAVRSRELAAQGHLLRLWRPPLQPGQWRTPGEFLGIAGHGRPICFRLLHVWEFKTGRISRENVWLQPLTGVISTRSPNRPNPSACTGPASWRATDSGSKSTPWRPSTARRWWTSSRPSTRPPDALHTPVSSGGLPAREPYVPAGQAIRPEPNSPLSSSSNAAMGSRTAVSQNALDALR